MRLGRLGPLVLLWIGFLAVECVAQLGLKIGSDVVAGLPFGVEWLGNALGSPWVLVGILCYLLAFVFWMLILDKMELSLAFPLSGLVYVVVIGASALGLHESLTSLHVVGVALIVAGVCVMGQD